MTQTKLEIKKIIFNRLFIISTVILIGFFTVHAVEKIKNISTSYAHPQRFYSQISDNPGSKEIADLKEKMDEISFDAFNPLLDPIPDGEYGENVRIDYLIISQAIEQIKYSQYEFHNDMTLTVKQAYKNMLAEKENGNKYLERYYEKVISKYNTKKDIAIINGRAVYDFLEVFHFSWGSMLFNIFSILWVLFLSAYILNCEKGHGMNEIVYSTVNGRKKLFMRKLKAILIIIVGMTLLIILAEMFIGIFVYHIRDFTATIQSVPYFEFCSFKLNIIQTFLLMHLMRMLSIIFVAAVMTLLSIKAKSLMRPLISGFILFAGSWYALIYFGATHGIDAFEKLSKIRTFYPLALSQPEDYFLKFDYQKFMNYPVNSLFSCIIIFIIISTVCVAVSSRFYGKAGK